MEIKRRKVIFYGDSNTYGYDPADMMEGRFSSEIRWPEQVAKRLETEWEVIPMGMNGRKLPERNYDFQRIRELAEPLEENDLFAVMLGTNDLLLTADPDAQKPLSRMDELLKTLTSCLKPGQILILAPVWIGTEPVIDPFYLRYRKESQKMNAGFRKLAEKYHVRFHDTADWQICLAFDQVHFSEDGCQRFADQMVHVLQGLKGEENASV